MNLDEVTADLLARPLDQFTAERNTRAKELKAQGKGELAAAVAKLKKPPVHVWAANRAARQNATLLGKLREAAQQVARAQTGRSTNPRELRSASERFQEALDDAVRAAGDVLRGNSHAATEEAERRIREIFRVAAMQGGESLEQLKQGALLSEPAAGDDVMAMFQAGVPTPHPALPPEGGGKNAHEQRAAERTARLDAERAEQLEATARRLRAEADEAAAQAKRADERAREAEKEAAGARAQASKSARAVTPPRPSVARRR